MNEQMKIQEMDITEFSYDSFLNKVAKDVQKAALLLSAFSVGMDVLLVLNGIFAPFSPFLLLFVPIYLAARYFTSSLHITSERVLFKRRLLGRDFDKCRALNKAKYIDLNWCMKSGGGTGRAGTFSLDIDIATAELVHEPRIYLGFDMHIGPEDQPYDVADILHKLHLATGLPMQFEALAAERFYEPYVSRYGLSAIMTPRLMA